MVLQKPKKPKNALIRLIKQNHGFRELAISIKRKFLDILYLQYYCFRLLIYDLNEQQNPRIILIQFYK